MIFVSDGRPCVIGLNGLPTHQDNPETDVAVSQLPVHGTVRVAGHRAKYTPEAGYAGEDAFVVTVRAAGASGQALPLKVQVKVTIHGAP